MVKRDSTGRYKLIITEYEILYASTCVRRGRSIQYSKERDSTDVTNNNKLNTRYGIDIIGFIYSERYASK